MDAERPRLVHGGDHNTRYSGMTNGNSQCRIEIDSITAGFMSGDRRGDGAASQAQEGRASVNRERNVHASMFGGNTYSYMRSHSAEACLARLAELGFQEFELMVHPGHLWPAELSAGSAAPSAAGSSSAVCSSPRSTCRTSTSTSPAPRRNARLFAQPVDRNGAARRRARRARRGDRSRQSQPAVSRRRRRTDRTFLSRVRPTLPGGRSRGTALWVENMPFAFLPAIGGLMDALTQYGNDAVRIVYDVANAYFIGEDFADGLKQCRERLALVHLSDTGQQFYRHDPVGLGTVPFAEVPRALAAVGYTSAADAGDHLARSRPRHHCQRQQTRATRLHLRRSSSITEVQEAS